MQLPFTTEQFLEIILRYNEAVWPMQAVLYLVAAAMIWQAARRSGGSRWVTLTLGFMWAWMGVVYNWLFFTEINPAAWGFGAFFVLQALLFVLADVKGLAFRLELDAFGLTGAVFLLYGLVLYPVLGALAGHAYPSGPTLGLPCPTTIVTFGVLLWASHKVPVWLLIVPAVWSLIGSSAAFQFGIREDYGLLVAGVLGTVLVLVKNRGLPSAAQAEMPAEPVGA